MNLYEEQAVNRRKTSLIMSAFVLVLFSIGAGFEISFGGSAHVCITDPLGRR